MSNCPHGYVAGVCCEWQDRGDLKETRSKLYQERKAHKTLIRDVDYLLRSILCGSETLSDFGQDVIKRVRKAAKW